MDKPSPSGASAANAPEGQDLTDEEMRAWGSYWACLARMPPLGLADAAHRLFLEVDRRRRASGLLVKHMVSRFLGWKLPENFRPDDGISFTPTNNEGTPYQTKHSPTGTNLFDATQAEAMVRYLLDGMPLRAQPADAATLGPDGVSALRLAELAIDDVQRLCDADPEIYDALDGDGDGLPGRRRREALTAVRAALTSAPLVQPNREDRDLLLRALKWLLKCETCDPEHPGQMSVLVDVLAPNEREVYGLEPCAQCEGEPEKVAIRAALEQADDDALREALKKALEEA